MDKLAILLWQLVVPLRHKEVDAFAYLFVQQFGRGELLVVQFGPPQQGRLLLMRIVFLNIDGESLLKILFFVFVAEEHLTVGGEADDLERVGQASPKAALLVL